MTTAVITAEINKTIEQPLKTMARALLTPVSNAVVTKMLRGTRERADNVARCSSEMIEERSMPSKVMDSVA